MARKKRGTELQHPEVMIFRLRPVLANRFRQHCLHKGLVMSAMVEKMMTEFLIAEGDIQVAESLNIQEALEK